MNATRFSVENPLAVLVIVGLLCVFSLISFIKLPVQMLPRVELPQLEIITDWRGAAPAEIESRIVEPQEQALLGVTDLVEISSNSYRGFGIITMTFRIDTDMDDVLINVINRINQAARLPADAGEPFIYSGTNERLAFLWVLPTRSDIEVDLAQYQSLFRKVINPQLTKIPGVAQVEYISERNDHLKITFDPTRAAAFGLTIQDIASKIARAQDQSGGFVDIGNKQYIVRVAGGYDVSSLGSLVIRWNDGQPIKLSDVATVEATLEPQYVFSALNGRPAFGIGIDRKYGGNVIESVDEIKRIIHELNEGQLKEAGFELVMTADNSVFIKRAVSLVESSLLIGVILAIIALYVLLRGLRRIAAIALSVPLCLMLVVLILDLLDRSLNVVSLAGLAIASGLVLDASIIVQESIIKELSLGKNRLKASIDGALKVGPALLASTLTSVAIFIPVLFMQDIPGQIFSDLALTIAGAVMLSFLVSIIVIPAISANLRLENKVSDPLEQIWEKTTQWLMNLSRPGTRRIALIAALLVLPITSMFLLLPDSDFLPTVEGDRVDVYLDLPPGTSLPSLKDEVAEPIISRLKPYIDGNQEPIISDYFLYANGSTYAGMGLRTKDPKRTNELIKLLEEEILVGIPSLEGYVSRINLLDVVLPEQSQIKMDIVGQDLDALLETATVARDRINEVLSDATVQAEPRLILTEPEIRLKPIDNKLLSAGIDRESFSQFVRAMTSGFYVADHFDGNISREVILQGGLWNTPEQLLSQPIATAQGIRSLGEFAEIEDRRGPAQLQRINGTRTVTLNVSPPEQMTLAQTLALIKSDVEPKVNSIMKSDQHLLYRGSADGLAKSMKTMLQNFILGLLILWAIITALFRSIKDGIIVMITLPLATTGGIIALKIYNLIDYQALDLMTMIGFVILLGLVINNAILLVDETRRQERDGAQREKALAIAIRNRLRPIAISTLTSIMGMLPLMLIPGLGAEIYRGLALVIVGGMMLSGLFTLILLPCLLRVSHSLTKSANADTTLSEQEFSHVH